MAKLFTMKTYVIKYYVFGILLFLMFDIGVRLLVTHIYGQVFWPTSVFLFLAAMLWGWNLDTIAFWAYKRVTYIRVMRVLNKTSKKQKQEHGKENNS